MKKRVLICMMVLVLLGSVVSCDIKANLETGKQTTSEDNKASTEDEIDVDPVFSVLTDIDAYRKYVSQHKMPSDFITYEKLSSIGEFVSLTFRASHYDYHYKLVDKNGFVVMVSVSQLQSGEDLVSGDVSGREILRPEKLESENILFNKENEHVIILYNDTKYGYYYGALRSVSFIAGEYMITFTPDSVYNEETGKSEYLSFAEYKPEKENILTQLLKGNAIEADSLIQ